MSIDLDIQCAWMPIPLGYLKISSSILGIQAATFEDQMPQGEATRPSDHTYRPLRQAIEQFEAYFAGHLKVFTFPISPEGTPFQMRVWDKLIDIPYGNTISYAVLAQKLGGKNLARAVGMANGKNPIAIAIPCHRVVGNNGSLTGYAGGLWRKEWLLKHEAQSSGKPIQLSLF